MDLDTRIANLVAAAGATPMEQEMLHSRVLSSGVHLTAHPGSSHPIAVFLETRRSGFFKSFVGQSVTMCGHYKQDPFEVPLNEVIAWRLAHAMGPPWMQMVPTAVLRKIDDKGGALINQRHGPPDAAVFGEAPSQAASAAFWDALIGNQDRNTTNFRYLSARKSLGLIDHGFAFARPGDPFNESFFLRSRRQANRVPLTPHEREALENLVDNELHRLGSFLPRDRAEALQARAETMIRTSCLPVANVF